MKTTEERIEFLIHEGIQGQVIRLEEVSEKPLPLRLPEVPFNVEKYMDQAWEKNR